MSEGFVGRWARLKTAERRRAQRPLVADPAADPAPPVAAAPGPERPDPVAELPPIESLTKDSDFTAFLKEGVPEGLKNAALRRLWRSDPVLAAPEVLDLHNLDYTFPKTPEIVRTAYQIGKGYLEAAPRDDVAATAKQPDAAEPGKEPPAETKRDA
jgi:hypothetical protein